MIKSLRSVISVPFASVLQHKTYHCNAINMKKQTIAIAIATVKCVINIFELLQIPFPYKFSTHFARAFSCFRPDLINWSAAEKNLIGRILFIFCDAKNIRFSRFNIKLFSNLKWSDFIAVDEQHAICVSNPSPPALLLFELSRFNNVGELLHCSNLAYNIFLPLVVVLFIWPCAL